VDGPQDQADAIIAALDQGAARRVLAVHSGAALAGTLVIDQHPGLVDHVVWVDTAPVPDGYAMNPELTTEWYRLEDAWAQEEEGGAMRDLTRQQLDTFRERAVPEAATLLTTAVQLSDDRRHDVASTVVCTEYSAEDYRSYAEQGVPFLAALPHYRTLDYVDLPTGHWPMWSRPKELAALIADAAG
jgi:pimeloyl-ACP methyl ester carboxylesterase